MTARRPGGRRAAQRDRRRHPRARRAAAVGARAGAHARHLAPDAARRPARARGRGARAARPRLGHLRHRPAAAAQQPGAQCRRHRRDRVVTARSPAPASGRWPRSPRRPGSSEALGVEQALVVRRVRTADGRPVVYSVDYVRPGTPVDGESLYAALRRAPSTTASPRCGRSPPTRSWPTRSASRRARRCSSCGRSTTTRPTQAIAAAAGVPRRRRVRLHGLPPGPGVKRPGARHRRRLAGNLRAADRRAGRDAGGRLRGLRRPVSAAGLGRAGPARLAGRAQPHGRRGDGRRRPVANRGAVVRRAAGRTGRASTSAGEPLRDAIIWMDRRGDDVCGALAERVDPEQLYATAAATSTAGTSARRSPGSASTSPRSSGGRRGSCCPDRSWRWQRPACTASTPRTRPARCWSTSAPASGTRASARGSASTRRALAPMVPPHGVLEHHRAVAARGDRAARRGARGVRLRRRDGRDARRRRRRSGRRLRRDRHGGADLRRHLRAGVRPDPARRAAPARGPRDVAAREPGLRLRRRVPLVPRPPRPRGARPRRRGARRRVRAAERARRRRRRPAPRVRSGCRA